VRHHPMGPDPLALVSAAVLLEGVPRQIFQRARARSRSVAPMARISEGGIAPYPSMACVGQRFRVGMSVREIAEEIGATKSAVHRMKQRIEREAEVGEGEGEGG
jgi:hypothetical protein